MTSPYSALRAMARPVDVAVVEFPGYAEAMANSGHPATAAFAKELQSISASEPEFRNLDVHGVAS
jgi:hypothetical protein